MTRMRMMRITRKKRMRTMDKHNDNNNNSTIKKKKNFGRDNVNKDSNKK